MYNFIFTGGGSRGFAYVGVLKAIEERNPEINIYSGSSIGAVLLTMFALGYSYYEIKTEFEKINKALLFSDINPNLFSDLCISKGEFYLKKLRELIERRYYGEKYIKGKMHPVCFKDINKKIYIAASNLETGETEIFSKETTPYVEIAKALRASSSMPFLMKPYKLNGQTYIDGDILRANAIYKYIPEILNENCIEFRLTGGKRTKPTKNPIKFVNNVVSICADAIDENAAEQYADLYKIIKIELPCAGFSEFFINNEKKRELYNSGYKNTVCKLLTKKKRFDNICLNSVF